MLLQQKLQRVLTAAERPEPFFDNWFEQVTIVPTGMIGIEALVRQQLRLAHVLHEAFPLMIQDREYDPTVAGPKQTAGGGARTMTPGRTRVVIAVGEQILHQEDVMNMEDAFVQRHV